MKKILVLLVIACAGYWIYTNYVSNASSMPYVGEWRPNEEKFLEEAARNGASADQQSQIVNILKNTKLIIGSKKITFVFPDVKGDFDFVATDVGGGCYNFSMTEGGDGQICVNGDQLTMLRKETGVVEYFDRQK